MLKITLTYQFESNSTPKDILQIVSPSSTLLTIYFCPIDFHHISKSSHLSNIYHCMFSHRFSMRKIGSSISQSVQSRRNAINRLLSISVQCPSASTIYANYLFNLHLHGLLGASQRLLTCPVLQKVHGQFVQQCALRRSPDLWSVAEEKCRHAFSVSFGLTGRSRRLCRTVFTLLALFSTTFCLMNGIVWRCGISRFGHGNLVSRRTPSV